MSVKNVIGPDIGVRVLSCKPCVGLAVGVDPHVDARSMIAVIAIDPWARADDILKREVIACQDCFESRCCCANVVCDSRSSVLESDVVGQMPGTSARDCTQTRTCRVCAPTEKSTFVDLEDANVVESRQGGGLSM